MVITWSYIMFKELYLPLVIGFVRAKTENHANKILLGSCIISNSHTDLDTENALFVSNVNWESNKHVIKNYKDIIYAEAATKSCS